MSKTSPGRFIDDFWFQTVGDEIRLVGSRCLACGKVAFPQKPVCPVCFSDGIETVPLSKNGTLHTFACSVMGPIGMETPFVMGFIDLPEGIKLYSLITGTETWGRDLKIGMAMEMTIGKIKVDASGREVLSYRFRPCREEEPQ